MIQSSLRAVVVTHRAPLLQQVESEPQQAVSQPGEQPHADLCVDDICDFFFKALFTTLALVCIGFTS